MKSESKEKILFASLQLNERLLKALEQLGFSEAMPVQSAMLPAAMAGHDLQVSAETGSGKTAAYLLPTLHRMLAQEDRDSATRCLVLVPTRELAYQVWKDCQALAAFTRLQAEMVVGGMPFKEQRALLRKNPEILVATPGRLLEHLQKKAVDLSELECLVLDEADRMLDMGFREEVQAIIAACSPRRQTLLLSATLRHQGIGRIASEVLREPQIIDLASAREQPVGIRQQIILADDPAHKQNLVAWLLANEAYEKALIFTNTRDHADQLSLYLQAHKQRVAALHGEMSQEDRKAVMSRYRSGGLRILVATDLAARGLDIAGVELVINFSMARSGDEYVHRIGRTGRAGQEGLAISLISPQEWNLMDSIQRYLAVSFEPRVVEALPSRFKGPVKKKKSSAKSKAKDAKGGAGKRRETEGKAKQRHRNQKNIGKRRKPKSLALGDGLAPLQRKD